LFRERAQVSQDAYKENAPSHSHLKALQPDVAYKESLAVVLLPSSLYRHIHKAGISVLTMIGFKVFFFLLITAFVPLGALSSVARSWVPDSGASGLRERDDDQHGPLEESTGNWLGWGADVYNNRLAAPDAVVNAANVVSLHRVCQKEYSFGVSATPLVVNGIVYYLTWSGLLVALNYKRCKVLWQTNISEISIAYKPVPTQLLQVVYTVSRTTPMLSGDVLILGTQANALLLAIDKQNGKLVDQIQLNDHPTAVITMSPTVWQGRIFVGTSSDEEATAAAVPRYVCCSFVGNMNGLVFQHGHFSLLWTQTIVPLGSNFSGGAVWGSQPAIDPARNRVLIGTGNVYSVPDSYTACRNKTANTTTTQSQNTTDPCAPPGLYQESVIAFDTATGHVAWFREFNPIDAWNLACLPPFGTTNPGACPPSPGRDADFGMAPTFVPASPDTPFGEDTIVIGQKNGNLYGLSARDGKLFWATATSPDGLTGGLIWGIAVDSSAVYYTAINSLRTPWQLQDGTKLSNGAFGAVSLTTGKILWETPVPRNSSSFVPPSVVHDVVLVGVSGPYVGFLQAAAPGTLLPLNKHTGAIIKETTLDTYWQGGVAIVQEYVMFGTGYQRTPNGTFNVFTVSK